MPGPVAYLQTIAAGVLQEDRVITGFVGHGSLHIAVSATLSDCRQQFHLPHASGPKGNPVLVGDVTRTLRHPEKLRDVAVRRCKLQVTPFA